MMPKRWEPGERLKLAEQDERVGRWFKSEKGANETRARIYLGNVSRILEETELTVDALLSFARHEPVKLESALIQFKARRQEPTHKPKPTTDASIGQMFAALQSFLKHEHVEFRDYPKLKIIQGVTLSNERVPTQQELGYICAALTPRWRAAALLIAHSGIRPGVLCINPSRKNGARALQIRHLVDFDLKTRKFGKVPFEIRVPAELSKTGKVYSSFGGQECADALEAYLGEREHLTSDSFVIVGKLDREGTDYENEPVTSPSLASSLARGISKVIPDGVRWRPYVLRAFFSTRLMLAESRGLIVRELRESLLGHSVGVGSRYNIGKRWDDQLLKEAREMYRKSMPFLESRASDVEVANDRTIRRNILEGPVVSGLFTSREKERITGLTAEEFLTELQSRLQRAETPKVERKSVSLEEAKNLLISGWKLIATLPDNSLVVESP